MVFSILKALVRKAEQEVVDMLPRSVEIVIGDVGDPDTLNAAVEGCNKIIYCATARSAITGDLFRVDHRGVYNLCKAFQVSLHASKSLTPSLPCVVCVCLCYKEEMIYQG